MAVKPGQQFGISGPVNNNHQNPVAAQQYHGNVGGQFRQPTHFSPMSSHSTLTSTFVGRSINASPWGGRPAPLSKATIGGAANWAAIGTGTAASGNR